jgi:Domain of unknown function (DUF4258)
MQHRDKRPQKLANVLGYARTCVESGRYLDTVHSADRQSQRSITRQEILYVVKNGYHEKSKDAFIASYQAWNYAIRGKTVDGRRLRVIVSFEAAQLLFITAIDLDR